MLRREAQRDPWSALFLLLAMLLACLASPRARALDPTKAFEQYVANRWSIQDGLPQISVLAIAQDHDGFIWVGTQSGLARFDGVHFTAYTTDTTPQLPGIWIRDLLVDREGNLWIATYKGLVKRANHRFLAIPPADASTHLSPDVYDLAQAADGTILAATDSGLMQVRDDALQPVRTTVKPALSVLPSGNDVWIGTTGAVVKLSSGTATRLPLPQAAENAEVTRLVHAQGRLWAGTSQGLYVLTDGAWTAFADDPKLAVWPVGALVEDHDHNLWVGTNPALWRIRDGHVVETIVGQVPLTYKDVRCAFEDREGNLWLGSQIEGLTRIWNGWTRRYSTAQGLNDPVVWSLARAADGTIWVGTSNGVSVLDHGHASVVVDGTRLPHPHAYNLFAEGDTLWIGTRHGLAIRHADGSIETSAVFAPMASAQINGITRGPGGALWFATSQGLFRLEHEGQPDEHLRRYGPAEGLTDVRVRLIVWQHDGSALVGTQSGLYVMRGDRLAASGVDQGLPREIDINTIAIVPEGPILIGTQSEQLFVYGAGRWRLLQAAQGMPSNAAFFMTPDDRGFLWIAGIRGVARVPIADLKAFAAGKLEHVRGEMILNERGDRNAGQQGFCCNGAGMSKGFIQDRHVLWLPSRDGVVSIDTHGIVKNKVVPTPVIERVDESRGSFIPSALPAALPASERDLGFDFTAPSFQDPRSVQIRYRLVGYDRDWHVVEDPRQRHANYTNLPPRDYTFEVMAANNAGVWNPVPAKVSFAIRPYFHETRLFDVLIGLLVVAVVYAGYRRQRHAHEVQRAGLERTVEERTQQLHVSNARLENASQIDPATGLRNARFLAHQMPTDLAFYDREQQRDGSFGQTLLFAMVHLRRSDEKGTNAPQAVGDRAIAQFTQVLGSLVRAGDYIVRWEAQTLLLVLRPLPERQAPGVGARILQAAGGHAFDVGGGVHLALDVAVGIAEFPLRREALRRPGWEQLASLAQAAMHWARRQGADTWVQFRPTLRSDLMNILQELQDDPAPLIASGRLKVLGSRTSGDGDSNPGAA